MIPQLRISQPLLLIIAIALFLHTPERVAAQWISIGNIDSMLKVDDGIRIFAHPAAVRITVLAPDVIRVRMSPDGKFLPDSSWAVIQNKLGSQEFRFTDSKEA